MTLTKKDLFHSRKQESMNKKHFDGWGHPILGYFGMLEYYSDDRRSLGVLRRFATFQYVVIPDVEIVVTLGNPVDVKISVIWPGGKCLFSHKTEARVVNAIRRLYSSKTGEWRISRGENQIVLHRRGYLYPLKISRNWDGVRGEGV